MRCNHVRSLVDRTLGGVLGVCAVGMALFLCRHYKEKRRSRGDVYVSGKTGKSYDVEQSDYENGSGVRITEGPRSSGSVPSYSSDTIGAGRGYSAAGSLPFTRPQRNGDYDPLDKNADALLEKLGMLYSNTERGSQRQQVRGCIHTQQAIRHAATHFAGAHVAFLIAHAQAHMTSRRNTSYSFQGAL